MGDVALYQGDCLEIMPKLAPESVDLILADLPFGQTACDWDRIIPVSRLWSEYRHVLRPEGAIVLFGIQPFTSLLIASNVDQFRYAWVWEKNRPTNPMNADNRPLRAHEDIAIFGRCDTYNPQMTRGKPYSLFNGRHKSGLGEVYGKTNSVHQENSGSRYPITVLHFDSVHGGFHPTEKPVDLLAYLVRTYTNVGDTVLDNTMGSGSTLVACIKTERRGIGIELDEHYFLLAEKRVLEAEMQPTLIGEILDDH